MRLQKVLQKSGVCSRREAVKIICQGRVCVDGVVVDKPGHVVDPQNETISLDGKALSFEQLVLYAFNKPSGVVCSMRRQGDRPYLGDFFKEIPQRVVPVGRLDKDVTGLLLITNDGDFAQLLAHPRHSTPRVYWAVCRGSTEQAKQAAVEIRSGVELGDGVGTAKDFSVLELTNELEEHLGELPEACVAIELCVTEGRHHFVKRLLAAVGLPVVKLSRISFGPYSLKSLESGSLREEKFESFSNSVDK